MKKILTPIAFIVFALVTTHAQVLLDSEFLGSKNKTQLIAQTGNFLIEYGAKYYKLTYATVDAQGQPTTATGLLVIPDDPAKKYPMLCYQHGTSSAIDDVPSALNLESSLVLSFGGMGYISFAPDYIGLGDSPGFHPYVHAASEATAGVDGLRAAREFAATNAVFFNDQVFLTGYSQGGHASMALHRMLETELSAEFQVTRAAHLSGPYSISEVMRGILFSDEPYGNPAYLVNTLFSYQYVYGNLFNDISEAVRPAYVDMVTKFLNAEISLATLNNQLIAGLEQSEGAAIPAKVFNDDYVAAVLNDPNHPANLAMLDNDVFKWVPASPTRLYFCTADDQVPFENSVLAETEMLALGAANLDAIDVNSTANHTGCVVPAAFNTILFFGEARMIENATTSSLDEAVSTLTISPNPTDGWVTVSQTSQQPAKITVTDLHGRAVLLQTLSNSTQSIWVGDLENGLYLLDYQDAARREVVKLVVRQ